MPAEGTDGVGIPGIPGNGGIDVGSPNFANPGIVGASGSSGILIIGSVDLLALIAATTVGVINGTTKSLYNPLYEILGIGTAGIIFSISSLSLLNNENGFKSIPLNPPFAASSGVTKCVTKNCLPSIASLKNILYGKGAEIPFSKILFVIKSAWKLSHSTHKNPKRNRKILNTLRSFATPCHVSPI